jgi:hypothetical protein
MATKTTKRDGSSVPREGRYEWRDEKTGKFRGVEIIRPARGPSNTSVAEIRRAVDMTHGGRKAK